MASISKSAGGPQGPPALLTGETESLWVTLLKYLGLFIFDALGLIITYTLLRDDNLLLAFVFFVITLMMNVFILVPRLYPFKWMSPGLALVTLLVIYPIIYTVIVAFTNYGDGHLYTKAQTIALIERRKYLPDDAMVYGWTLFAADAGGYALWLTREADDAGAAETLFAVPGEPLEVVDAEAMQEAPETYGAYKQLERAERAKALNDVQDMRFGPEEDSVGIKSRREAGRPFQAQYVYDAERNALYDRASDTYYLADESLGLFIPEGGAEEDALIPGYRVYVGLENFARLVTDPGLRGPLVRLFVWTVAFAALSVLFTFAMGLFIALLLDDPVLPARKLIRSLLFIPYAVPGAISILAWRGMLNPNLGVISVNIQEIFGVSIPWFTDPFWAKVSILLVNLWLGYPYMMLVCSGALQTIPRDIYEAAAVDGANNWQRFWGITLPLLLIVVGPLLIASFSYNFNNYLIIEALTEGDPPIAGTLTPAGHSDLLINYTYNLAFGSDRGADYGYASVITLANFALVAGVTLLQYRYTRTWEEVSENV